MAPERLPLHHREIPGIVSRTVTTWRGKPLRGLYFVESTLAGVATSGDSPKGPALLLPGSWDPREGEYSDNLIRNLLQASGAPAVLEGHYRFDDQDGYVEPAALVDDLTSIYLDHEDPPTVVGLCFSCPFVLEALLKACEQEPTPPVAGVLVIGLGVPGFLNAVGRTALHSHINMKVGAEARHLKYTGHAHTAGNNARGESWIRDSRLTRAMRAVDQDAPIQPFPVPVDALYFRLDVATRQARQLTRHVFGITGKRPAIPGYHRSLRRRSPADAMIAAFYEETQGMSRPNSLDLDASPGVRTSAD